MEDRTKTFIAAARKLRKPCDGPIEHTIFQGGGVRLKGFAGISGRAITHLLHSYGKRANFRLNIPSTDQLYIDCYDNMEPKTLSPCTPESMVPKPTPQAKEYQCGAVLYSQFGCDTLTSENLRQLLMESTSLDCKIRPHGFTLLRVSPASTKIVGGLSSEIQTNERIRNFTGVERKHIYFKRGAQKFRQSKRKRRFVFTK